MSPTFTPVADSAILVEFENRIAEQVNDRVLALLAALQAVQTQGAIDGPINGIIEAVPAYRTLLVYYDPLRIDYDAICDRLTKLASSESTRKPKGKRWLVPVWYGGPAAKDLKAVAKKTGLSTEEVIEIHSRSVYRVYLVGFAPGWTFLGGLDERLHTPRLDSPRAEVPDGAISIAGQQGLICGSAMPSGWNLIGQTPERTWAPEREAPFFIEPGDEVEIRRIDGKEFRTLQKRAAAGERVSEEVGRGEGTRDGTSPGLLSPVGENRPASVACAAPTNSRKAPKDFVGAVLWPRP